MFWYVSFLSQTPVYHLNRILFARAVFAANVIVDVDVTQLIAF